MSEVELHLGPRPVLVDIFGNRTLLPTEDGKTRLQVTNWPRLCWPLNRPYLLSSVPGIAKPFPKRRLCPRASKNTSLSHFMEMNSLMLFKRYLRRNN